MIKPNKTREILVTFDTQNNVKNQPKFKREKSRTSLLQLKHSQETCKEKEVESTANFGHNKISSKVQKKHSNTATHRADHFYTSASIPYSSTYNYPYSKFLQYKINNTETTQGAGKSQKNHALSQVIRTNPNHQHIHTEGKRILIYWTTKTRILNTWKS